MIIRTNTAGVPDPNSYLKVSHYLEPGQWCKSKQLPKQWETASTASCTEKSSFYFLLFTWDAAAVLETDRDHRDMFRRLNIRYGHESSRTGKEANTD